MKVLFRFINHEVDLILSMEHYIIKNQQYVERIKNAFFRKKKKLKVENKSQKNKNMTHKFNI